MGQSEVIIQLCCVISNMCGDQNSATQDRFGVAGTCEGELLLGQAERLWALSCRKKMIIWEKPTFDNCVLCGIDGSAINTLTKHFPNCVVTMNFDRCSCFRSICNIGCLSLCVMYSNTHTRNKLPENLKLNPSYYIMYIIALLFCFERPVCVNIRSARINKLFSYIMKC